MPPSHRSLRYTLLRSAHSAASAIQGRFQRLRDALHHRIALDYVFEPRPDDVFVVTYPKSGTTLLQLVLYQLTTDGDMDFPHIDGVCPWWEMELHAGRPELLESVPSPRIFKSHLRYGMLPRTGRKIYVGRAVEDVAVSAYHHHCLVSGLDHDLGEFIQSFARGGWGAFGSWFAHLESWWPHRNDPDVLFLTFEEATADLAGTARKVAEFCGLEAGPEVLERVVRQCRFDAMQAHDDKFDPRLRRFSSTTGNFIRRGKSGEGRERLGEGDRRLLEERLTAVAERLGAAAGEPVAWTRLLRPAAARPVSDSA